MLISPGLNSPLMPVVAMLFELNLNQGLGDGIIIKEIKVKGKKHSLAIYTIR